MAYSSREITLTKSMDMSLVISKAEKGYIYNTLTESFRNQLKIKKPTVKKLGGIILQNTNNINTLLCSGGTFENDLQHYRNT